MADVVHESPETQPAKVPGAERPRWRWQVGLRTLILLTATIAAWMTSEINRRRSEWLKGRIATMRPLARELIIDDEAKAAVVQLEDLWSDDNRWDVYLPPGAYRLCVATRQIADEGLAPVVASRPISAGRHTIGLDVKKMKTAWRVQAECDGAMSLSAEEPLEWNSAHGSTSSGIFSESTQMPADQVIIMHRRIFLRTTEGDRGEVPDGPAKGILLWIEPVAGSTGRRLPGATTSAN